MAVPVKKFAGRTARICSSIRQAFVRIYLQKTPPTGRFLVGEILSLFRYV
jgi:hypothetical protein